MQTKLGSKINILVERLADLYHGKTNLKENDGKINDYKTTQPISQTPGHQPSQADFLNQQQAQRSTNMVSNNVVNNAQNQQSTSSITPPPPPHNFNNAFQGPNNPLVNAAEPMAANEGFGGMFGSAFN